MLQEWRQLINPQAIVVSTLKGIESGTDLRMTEVVQEVLGIPAAQLALITGPNLAGELSLRQPAGAVAAAIYQHGNEPAEPREPDGGAGVVGHRLCAQCGQPDKFGAG